MRQLTLNKSGMNKVKSRLRELKSTDFENSIKSTQPGEWCTLANLDSSFIGFINPLIDEQFTCFYIVESDGKKISPFDIVEEKIKVAISKRKRISSYSEGARLFYGISDGLPGLIIDSFVQVNIIQINTAGVDKYREEIKKIITDLTGKESYFLDNDQYRSKEFLPTFEKEILPDIQVKENSLTYQIRSQVLQKVGFYYDHRENRKQLATLMGRLDIEWNKGIDLFSYIGAWGMTALQAGCKEMDFVDQGDFQEEVNLGLKLNMLEGKGRFHRGDVFSFLDKKIQEKSYYSLILCDPPAFAKSMNQRKQAIEGYSKLHRRVFRLASQNALCAFSSCTHYVSHEDFLKNIQEAALKENRKIQLLYMGIQGWDHPVSSLSDKSNYIKSYFYFVE